MSGWEKLCILITDDILLSVIVAVSLLVIGYVCSATSKNCVCSFHIGQSRDTAAGRFALASLMLYIAAGVTLAVIGIHLFRIEERKGTWNRMTVKNSISYELSTPLIDWFNEIYDEFKSDIAIK